MKRGLRWVHCCRHLPHLHIMVSSKMSNAAERDQRKLLGAQQQQNYFGGVLHMCLIWIHHTIPQNRAK